MKGMFKLFFLKLNRLLGKSALPKIVFITLGISSTLWFLIRVIPKPQRATYPCMRAAAPLMSSFAIYLLTVLGSACAFRKAGKSFDRGRYIATAMFLVVAVVCSVLFFGNEREELYARAIHVPKIETNQPIGVERGIFPGREVWVCILYRSDAADE